MPPGSAKAIPLAVLISLPLTALSCENIATRTKLTTGFGTVTIITPEDSGLSSVAVNGTPVYTPEQDPQVKLYRHFNTSQGSAILFGSNAGGSSTPQDQLYFLLLQAGRRPRVITDENFYSATCTSRIHTDRNAVVIDLGFESGHKKIATLRNDKLTIISKAATSKALNVRDCSLLYQTAAEECVGDNSSCQDYSTGYLGNSVSSMTTITAISQSPGFNSAALTSACVLQCKAGQAMPFKQFSQSVCQRSE
jgi:hypothetical protein